MATLLNDCGCCAGVSTNVPRVIVNRPGLLQVRYRVGEHGDFLSSARAALSEPQFAALRHLTTRDSDDFTIAVLDGWSTLADVLTFYQERIANELWLRTATERESILRLAQLIGYRLKPGIAAETPLCFLLEEAPGAPAQVRVESGAKVQSVPGADEKPQTFETVAALDAHREWNALRPALTMPAAIAPGATVLYLRGIATTLQPGDAILIVGDERDQHPTAPPEKERWDLRILLSVTPDPKNSRTRITWEKGLGEGRILPAAANVRVYALRQRAALFGHNAPDESLITKPGGGAVGTWENFVLASDHIDLDSAYAKIIRGSWLTLTNSSGLVELYKAVRVSFPSRASFALSGKVTRIYPDTTEHLNAFGLRETMVHAGSERLEVADGPWLMPAAGSVAAALRRDPELLAPIEGSVIALDRLIPALAPGRRIVVTGKPVRVQVEAASLLLTSADGMQSRRVVREDSLVLTGRPTLLSGGMARWALRTNDGFAGEATTGQNQLVVVPAHDQDAAVSEVAVVQQCTGDPTVLTLENPPLAFLYDRATVSIAANVAEATHGETVTELLGSGSGSEPNQSFELKHAPVTYLRSNQPGGAESTLQIRVNNLLWHEVPTLFGRRSDERVFTTELADDGATTVRFGDGIRGARLPSGSQNVGATYRRGLGLDGLVRAGQLTTLLTRPPGLKAVVNPLAAEGADEPESLADAQRNAPLTVQTLDRVVSLEDYEGFSRSYAGIAKALATWTWDGRTRGVFLTVAGSRGAEISAALAQRLIATIHSAGDPFVPIRIRSYRPALFRLSGRVIVHPDYRAERVLAEAVETLRAAFSFEERSFGQPVVLSEVIALVQGVPGVVAVQLNALHRAQHAATINPRLEATLPHGGDPASLRAAELLTLDPAPIDLGIML
ncbi:MAG: putative baseplate assembly protein [Verrucomicrobiia bacterium]